MADFKKAFKKIMIYEGGYVNNPKDFGKETYKGISRKYNPDWSGWEIIDYYKTIDNFPNNLENDFVLQEKTKELYKINYWNKFSGDLIDSQCIANKLFDIAVNIGVNKSIKFLQFTLNILNKDDSNILRLEEDGRFGHKTNTALKYWAEKEEQTILKMLNILQGNHYLNLVSQSSNQKIFIRGWLSRINF